MARHVVNIEKLVEAQGGADDAGRRRGGGRATRNGPLVDRPTATVMLLRALIVSLPVALVWPSSAAGGYFTGSQLLEFCTSKNAILRSACLAYVEGAVDLLNDVQEDLPTKSKVCVPAGMGGEQVMDIVVRYLQAHPEKRQYTAAQEVVLALLQALPCPPN